MQHGAIFCFGSNLAGHHGGGAARYAMEKYGAAWGQGIGRAGHSYAIPTMDESLHVLPLDVIDGHLRDFADYAAKNNFDSFVLTPIGCGIAGYSIRDLWPILHRVKLPHNVTLHPSWVNDHAI